MRELDCSEIIATAETVCKTKAGERRECSELLAIAWLATIAGPLGRISASKRLGLSERRVRNLITKLKEQGLIKVDQVAGAYPTDLMPETLRRLDCARRGEDLVAILAPISHQLATLVDRHVVVLRDEIVLSIGSTRLKLIALKEDENIYAPRTPQDLASQYLSGLPNTGGRALIILFEKECTDYCCAASLYALYRLCTMYIRSSDRANTAIHS